MEVKIHVYSKDACPGCVTVKNFLQTKNLPYTITELNSDEDRAAFYEKVGNGVRQLPQVFVNDQRVGGLSGLIAALKQLKMH